MQLDTLDKRILFELDCDSRQSYSELARKLRHGRDRVEYRVERLVDLGVIRKFATAINIYRLGLTIYKTYLRLRTNKKRVKELFAYLEVRTDVYRVAAYDGNWDVNIAMIANSPRQFYDGHSELVSRFHDIIIECAIYTLVDVWWFKKGYFVGKGGPGIRTGGEPASLHIDRLEYDLLSHISHDSRIGYTDLAEKVGTTPAIAKYRLEQLESQGVIAGYRLEINHEKLDMLYFKVQLFLSSYQSRFLKRLFDFCESNPHITLFIVQLGECPVEIELEVESLSQYHQILDSLREEFSPLIENFRSLLVHSETFRWLPAQAALIGDENERKLLKNKK